MHILIVGAGLSGPLLAQGLRGCGLDVTLVERRTPAEHRNAGYRIHLDPQGDLALRSCLEPAAYELVLRTAGVPGSGWRVLDTELQVVQEMLVGQPEDPAAGRHLTVDRQTLREILLDGLDDITCYGVGFDGYELMEHGVRVRLTDGTDLAADVLVGADGSASRVRAQRIPGLQVIDIGQINIFGRTPLSPDVLGELPPAALDGFCIVIGPDGRSMPLAAHRFAHPPQAAADELRPGLRLSTGQDYLMWVLALPDRFLPAGALPADLVDFVAAQVGPWHPTLARLVSASQPGSVHATTVRSSRRPEPWDAGPVTLIGDAAHPMIPAGIGAAVALADAAGLAEDLGRVARGEAGLLDAVAGYEQRMRCYAFDAVEASEQRLSG